MSVNPPTRLKKKPQLLCVHIVQTVSVQRAVRMSEVCISYLIKLSCKVIPWINVTQVTARSTDRELRVCLMPSCAPYVNTLALRCGCYIFIIDFRRDSVFQPSSLHPSRWRIICVNTRERCLVKHIIHTLLMLSPSRFLALYRVGHFTAFHLLVLLND